MNASSQSASQRALLALQLIWVLGLLISGRAPYERTTWLMEVAPCLILMPVLWWTRQRYVFTPLVYALITLHGLILMLGGAYTYARVPLGFWMQEWFHFTRNNYDKIGHFAQGFVPAFVARELLVRVFAIKQRRLLAFLCVSVSLAISALYELVEWWSALLMGSGANEFLGTQGDVWDTQSDMFMALIGAACAMLLARWHDAAMRKLDEPRSQTS
jgi:putative membrane protein